LEIYITHPSTDLTFSDTVLGLKRRLTQEQTASNPTTWKPFRIYVLPRKL